MAALTTLDVLDDHLGTRSVDDIRRMSGREVLRLAERIREFTAKYPQADAPLGGQPSYLGGWPSANFWHAPESELIMSGLLYSDRILCKDPIADWFSDEQYQSADRSLAARTGYFDVKRQCLNVAGTREFIASVLPRMRAMSPLLKTGKLVLRPAAKTIFANRTSTQSLVQAVISTLRRKHSALSISGKFRPSHMAIEDNIRGMFPVVGGEQDAQVFRWIEAAVRHFAEEYMFASALGYRYVAPFDFEAFLCEEGLGESLRASHDVQILRGVLHSQLPLFRGLTPEIVASLEDDEDFAAFKAELAALYAGIPSNLTDNELSRYVAELEACNIRPILERLDRQSTRGVLSKLGLTSSSTAIRIGFGTAAGLAVKALGGLLFGPVGYAVPAFVGATVATLGGRVADLASGPQFQENRSMVVWKRLHAHERTPATEFRRATHKAVLPGEDLWGIPSEPGLNVLITDGLMLREEGIPGLPLVVQGPYERCNCGSGDKFKFCCKGLETWRPTFTG